MKKVSPTFFKGIKFIRVSNLPEDQVKALTEWLPPTCMITIQVEEDTLINDCIQYRDYEYWFENFYAREGVVGLAQI